MRLSLVALCAVAGVAGCGDSGNRPPDLAVALDLSIGLDMTRLPPECDVFANSGCPAGQKCTIGTDRGTPRDLCFAVSANSLGEGAACMAVTSGDRSGDDCAPGLICLDFPGDGPHCRKPCYVRGNCAAGQGCVLTTPTSTLKQTEAGIEVLRACIAGTNCDPVAQTVCSGGRGCWLSPADDVGRLGICLVSRHDTMAGGSCAAQADCAAGFRCDSLLFCRRYCYFQMPDGGAPGGSGSCPPAEGACDRFSFSGPLYGICGSQ